MKLGYRLCIYVGYCLNLDQASHDGCQQSPGKTKNYGEHKRQY